MTRRICYVARVDFLTKAGGDTVQWKTYKKAASSAGYECLEWFDDKPMPKADLFHVFNVDRPLEVYPKMRCATVKGIPFILSTIHHPNEWLVQLRQAEPPGGGLGRAFYLSPIGKNIPVSESIKEAVRLIADRRLRHLPDLIPGWSKRIRWLLENSSKVMLLAHKELNYLDADFKVRLKHPKIEVLPNWIDDIPSHTNRSPLLDGYAESPILVVGRIETRKNVRRIAELAARIQREVLFIGKPNPNEKAYLDSFRKIVNSNNCLRWIPGIPREELGACYAGASFLLNASYAEVSPLVDVEALAFGCPIATTRYAVHHELLPGGTRQVDAHDDESILSVLQWRPQRIAPKMVVDAKTCQSTLLATYDAVMKSNSALSAI